MFKSKILLALLFLVGITQCGIAKQSENEKNEVISGFLISYGGSFYFFNSCEKNTFKVDDLMRALKSDTLLLLSSGIPFYETKDEILLKMKNIRVNLDDTSINDKMKYLFIIPCEIGFTYYTECSDDKFYTNLVSIDKEMINFTVDNNCIFKYDYFKKIVSVNLSEEFNYNKELCEKAFYSSRPGVFDFTKEGK